MNDDSYYGMLVGFIFLIVASLIADVAFQIGVKSGHSDFTECMRLHGRPVGDGRNFRCEEQP